MIEIKKRVGTRIGKERNGRKELEQGLELERNGRNDSAIESETSQVIRHPLPCDSMHS